MFQSNHNNNNQLPAKSLPIQDASALMQVDKKEASVVVMEEKQNRGFMQAESIIIYTKRLQDDLHVMGLKIKHHEENMKLLKSQKNKLEESILDLQVMLGKFHSSTTPTAANGNHSLEETTEKILQCKKSAAGILWQLKAHHENQAVDLPLIKDVVGIVAMLGKVDDDNLSRLLSEFLGLETMLAVVCKTYHGVKALELYDNEGRINLNSGVHGLGTSIGRKLEGRFLVICLENLRPYAGEFVHNDAQRRLDILKPRFPNGELPPGFLGYAVNMINVDSTNLFCLTASGHGLRETLYYSLFSRLQVYKTRADIVCALPCITDGAISLDGGMIRTTGVFSLGNREDVDVKFPKSSVTSGLPDSYLESQRQINEMKWRKEKMEEDLKREKVLRDDAKFNFDKKKKEFLKFLADSSSYATQASQHQIPMAQNRFTSS
ncbi:protein DEFECTIVE IN MERISTEM SILENCING 3-like [Argentina anserina]|uniref:protein DEFECTIVE IN MERISTEM SILENCING 3-like n=1 Tax=Argentina anserina TaxID=57926 RepID=UPI00217664D6|nr:protein DEFECTIVE IN MERISTEM SILENCING 3-like [Potentilla anserina]